MIPLLDAIGNQKIQRRNGLFLLELFVSDVPKSPKLCVIANDTYYHPEFCDNIQLLETQHT